MCILLFHSGDKEPPRYKTCVNNIQEQMPLALARAFTEEFFTPDIQACHGRERGRWFLPCSVLQGNMSVVLKELKLALKERINEKDWLDSATKQRALNKAETIKEFVAYPNKILDTSFVNNFYTGVSATVQVIK